MSHPRRRTWHWNQALGIALHSLGLGHSTDAIFKRLRGEYPDIDSVDIYTVIETARDARVAASQWRSAGTSAMAIPAVIPIQPTLPKGIFQLGTVIKAPVSTTGQIKTLFARVSINQRDTLGYEQQQAIDELRLALDSGLNTGDSEVDGIIQSAIVRGLFKPITSGEDSRLVIEEWIAAQIPPYPTWVDFERQVQEVIDQILQDSLPGMMATDTTVSVVDITRGPILGRST